MEKQGLTLYQSKDSSVYHTVIKTKHGRLIYLSLLKNDEQFKVKEVYYLDRIRGGKYYTSPKKLTAVQFCEKELLGIIASQLDRNFYRLGYNNSMNKLSAEDFIASKLKEFSRGYKFLIMVGDGSIINGLPSDLTTRLANRLHRRIYLKIKYFKDGLGVIENCYYYDRKYKSKTKVVPQMLTTVFVNYNRQAIIDVVNRELDCDFTDIIIADNSIDVEKNAVALCGNI